MTQEEANNLLPQQISSVKPNPLKLKILGIAEPKFGKTSWMLSMPNSVLLATEEGHLFLPGYKIIIDAWRTREQEIWVDDDGIHHMTFTTAVQVITASNQFDFVITDTADMAGKMCLDYKLKELGITHASDWEYGKGHDLALNTPFRQEMGKLIHSGRGVGWTSHTELKDSRFSSGTKTRKECTLPGGLSKFLVPQADIILHGKFGPINPKTGKRYRIWQTEGSDDVLAGSRVQGAYRIPPRFIINSEDPYGQWSGFFQDSNKADEATEEYNRIMHDAKSAAAKPTVKGKPEASTGNEEAGDQPAVAETEEATPKMAAKPAVKKKAA